MTTKITPHSKHIWAACLLLISSSVAPAQKADAAKPVALVGGEKIQMEELKPLVGNQIQKLRMQEYEARRAALESLLGGKLLALEAKSRQITVVQLLEQEVESKVTAPTDGEAEAFFLARKNPRSPKFEDVRAQIKDGLKQMRFQAAQEEYTRTLWKKHQAVILLDPPREEVAFDPARLKGRANAPVTIVEFTDFECPACRSVQPLLTNLSRKYGDQLKIAIRDFPLRQIHRNAQQAALASRCAGEQGKFWEYHDLLFKGEKSLVKEGLTEYAASLKLDAPRFQACLESGKYATDVERDLQEGIRLGVNATPSFFVNGITVEGLSMADFEKVIDAELASAAAGR